MAPLFASPTAQGNKTDSNDAEAFCETVQRPNLGADARTAVSIASASTPDLGVAPAGAGGCGDVVSRYESVC